MNRKNVIRTLTVIAAVLLLGWLFFYLNDDTRGFKPVDTSVAVAQINSDNVKTAQIDDREQQLRLELKSASDETAGSTKVIAKYPTGYAVPLFDSLNGKGVKTNTAVNQPSVLGSLLVYMLPLLLLIALFVLFSRMQTGGRMGFGFGKSRAKQLTKDMPQTTFADVAGADEAVEELYEIKDFLQNPGRYQALGAKIPRGVLLYGPPGTGKTLLARAVAGEAGVPFFTISGSDFVEMFVGVGASRVRDLFEQAKQNSPCIIFVDEIDAVGRQRGAGLGGGHDEREQTLNQLLVEMDGFDAGGGLVVLAATNRPDVLDPALLRPGRFDRQVTVDAPDLRGRVDILRLYLRGRPVAGDVDLTDVARRCPGFTGAELANAVNEAALLAARASRPSIGMPDLAEGIERTVSGARNQAHVLSGDEQRTIAVHEAGHAVVAAACGRADAVHSVSIVARGRRLGRATTLLLDKDRTVLRRSDLERQLMVTLAGTAAENVAFGEMSTAVNDDLHTATQLARSMVTSYGMSDLGPVTIGERSPEVFLGAALQELDSVGNATRERIDAETRRIVEESSARAQAVLRAHRGVLDGVADALVERETLAGAELAALLSGVRPVGGARPATAP